MPPPFSSAPQVSPRHCRLHIPQTFPIIKHLLLLLLLLLSETYQPTLAFLTFPVQFPSFSFPFQIDLRFRRSSISSPAALLHDQNNPVSFLPSCLNLTPLVFLLLPLLSSSQSSFPTASADSQSLSCSSSSVLHPANITALGPASSTNKTPHHHPKLNHNKPNPCLPACLPAPLVRSTSRTTKPQALSSLISLSPRSIRIPLPICSLASFLAGSPSLHHLR